MNRIRVAVDARYHPNDTFGYSVYKVVAVASPGEGAPVRTLRRKSGLKRSEMPVHVDVMRGFCDIESLDTVRRRIRRIARSTAPLQLDFVDEGAILFLRSSALIQVIPSQPLALLSTALERSIGCISTSVHGEGFFRPHLPVCQNCSPDQLRSVARRARDVSLCAGFFTETIGLVGRVGSEYEGHWESIERYALRG